MIEVCGVSDPCSYDYFIIGLEHIVMHTQQIALSFDDLIVPLRHNDNRNYIRQPRTDYLFDDRKTLGVRIGNRNQKDRRCFCRIRQLFNQIIVIRCLDDFIFIRQHIGQLFSDLYLLFIQ